MAVVLDNMATERSTEESSEPGTEMGLEKCEKMG
jgi:hypothetical protein